ncbi:hypothetical protein CHS0354_040444 [Potamilus streckersoni]|uniref:HAUS augmin-like complex subunit 5 n=1 Tax=Potamilus streckersoni TaxID=2493646 RepID=A0AAE0T0P7_9BIVA|nr:hypothetical protein CHS0354_040444 [Potamilus streckersoni]
MAQNRDEDLATRLHDWAINEMHYHSQGRHVNTKLPTVEDFKQICRGQAVDILKWIITNVHSAQTVKKVKGNLALKGERMQPSYKVKYGQEEKYNKERSELLESRSELSQEVNCVLRDISHLDKDMERLQKDIAETEHEYQEQRSRIRDIQRKSALIETHSLKCRETVQEYEEYAKRINAKVEAITSYVKKGSEAETFYSRKKSSEDVSDGITSALESACGKNVRECCEAIGSFLNQVLQGSFGGNKAEMSQAKNLLWSQVEQTSREFSPLQIVMALTSNTQEASFVLREKTSRIDIRTDAQKLRFKYEKSGELHDLSSSPSVIQSVHELLSEREAAHFYRFIETEKYNNEAWKLEQKIQEVSEQIDKLLKKKFTQKPADLKLARAMLDTEANLTGKRTILHCLTEEGNRLRELMAKNAHEQEILYTKYQRIQDFKDLADKKQDLIRVLVKQNTNAQSRLDTQKQEIVSYIDRSLSSHHSQTHRLTTSLKGRVNTEIEMFASLNLPYLMFSSVDSALKSAVLDLSINHTRAPTVRPVFKKVLQCLNFPEFQAAEQLLPWILRTRSDIDNILYRLDLEKSAVQRFHPSDKDKDIASTIAELCEAVAEHDRKQMSELLPVLQQKINKTGKGLTDCMKVKDDVLAWWEQPAQSCVPWVTVDGHTLQHWIDKWTVMVTKLRQMLVK